MDISKYTLKRKYEQLDQEIDEHIDKKVLIDLQIEGINLQIFELQEKIERLRNKANIQGQIIERKINILNKSGYLRKDQ